MIIAGALVIGALLIGWLAPVSMARLGGRGNPGLELTWWLALASAAVTSIVTAGVLLVFGDHPHVIHGPWQACWAILGHPHVHPLDELVGVALLALLFLAAVRVAQSIRRRIQSQQRAHRAHLAAVSVSSLSRVGDVLWLEHDALFAYSIAGSPGLVVASTALHRLPGLHLDAVLRHERHHLRQRHHWMVIAADAVSDTLPRVPLFRATAAATRTLTELSADESAARDCGTDAVAAALLALGKSERSVALRLRRLSASAGSPPRGPLLVPHVMACLTSSVLPAILGGALVGTVITITC
ncbi:MAG TPA: hypothetical protein DGG94_08960 [Micromonosporaceae bacterium]|nr:hypothetical protein [Micromonosporaceae bacterium]HCU49914.1 hypothetical protein [Micromonosporaceae bacterium]